MSKTQLLFRVTDADSRDELEIASRYFKCVTSRRDVESPHSLTVGRFSVLPYYHEVNRDVLDTLINSNSEHEYIVNFDWYEDLRAITPETWHEHEFHRCQWEGPFVVKGTVTSKKHLFNKMMYAPTKRDALRVASDLRQDMHICNQGVLFRKYVPLETFEVGLNGLPFTNEWRFFFLGEKLIDYGYYWSLADSIPQEIPEGGVDFARAAAKIVAEHTRFFVIDIALTTEKKWVVIELNDGQQSGLSEIPPERFYRNLAGAIA